MATGSSFQCPSFWPTPGANGHAGPLLDDVEVEVCVVGAGIAGLSTAYNLVQEGVQVLVIDDGPLGGGESVRTTAHLVTALDRGYRSILETQGREVAARAAESHAWAIDCIEQNILREELPCSFQRLDGYLCTSGPEQEQELEEELAACRECGVEVYHTRDLPTGAPFSGAALRFASQAQFHPSRYLRALALGAQRRGARIALDTRAVAVSDESGVTIQTERGPVVSAQAVVLATNTPILRVHSLHFKQAAYRTFVIAALIPKGSMARALFWDLEQPFHYLRLAEREANAGEQSLLSGHDIVLVGGEDHRTGAAGDPCETYERLEHWARSRLPIRTVLHRWSGQLQETLDGLAFIGHLGNQLYVITGDCGNGMTHGTIGGRLVCDQILGRHNQWASIYDPMRTLSRRSARRLLRESGTTAAGYLDWITTLHLADGAGSLEPLEGRVVTRPGAAPQAIFRDEHGELHRFSAVCPHLGGIVRWNSLEQSWECPCHGSRFTATGELLNGPAACGLTRLEEPLPAPRQEQEPSVLPQQAAANRTAP